MSGWVEISIVRSPNLHNNFIDAYPDPNASIEFIS